MKRMIFTLSGVVILKVLFLGNFCFGREGAMVLKGLILDGFHFGRLCKSLKTDL